MPQFIHPRTRTGPAASRCAPVSSVRYARMEDHHPSQDLRHLGTLSPDTRFDVAASCGLLRKHSREDGTSSVRLVTRRPCGNLESCTSRRRIVQKRLLFVTLAILMASCSSGVSRPSLTPGVLSGVVLGHQSQGTDQTRLADAPVGVFRQAVSSGGPVLQSPPKPVATTTTNSDGVFEFRTLPAGRWFVLALDQAGQGTWVLFNPATGAVVTLSVCTDCPVPL